MSELENSGDFQRNGEFSEGQTGSLDNGSITFSMEYGSQETEPSIEEDGESSNEKPFQELSIQWLNMAKVKKHFLESIKTASSEVERCKTIIDKIIQEYNNLNNNGKQERVYNAERTWDESDYFMKSFSCVIDNKRPTLLTQAVATKDHRNKTIYYIIFYFRKDENTNTQIVALSSGQAYSVVRPHVDHTFPFKMAEEIADPDQIHRLDRYSIVGKGLKECLFKPTKLDLCKTSNFYYLIEHMTCSVRKGSCFHKFFDKENDKPLKENVSVKFSSSGLLRIFKRLSRLEYPPILRLFKEYMDKIKSAMTDDEETKYRTFEFLYHIRPSKYFKKELDNSLAGTIYEQHRRGQKMHYHVHHKYLEDYLFSNDVEIKIGTGHFRRLARRPEIEDIVQIINAANKEIFREKIIEGKLRFTDRSGRVQTDSIIDCIEGQLRHESGETLFKIRKVWYETRAEYLSLLYEDFRAVLQKALIPKRDREDQEYNGQLERVWTENVATKGQITEKILEDELNFSEKEASNLMSELTKLQVSFISVEQCVNSNELGADILKSAEVSKHKCAIEQVLSDPGNRRNLELKIKKVCGECDAKKVWNKLTKKRSVLRKFKGGTYVIHPFPYQLKRELNYGPLSQLLLKLYHQRAQELRDAEFEQRKRNFSVGQLTSQILEEELNLEESAAFELMSRLKKLKVSYVSSEYSVKQQRLVGEILKYSAFEEYKDPIADILRDPENWWNLESRIREVCKNKTSKVLKELEEERHVLKSTNNKKYVINPFVYQLEDRPYHGALSKLLVDAYVPYIKEEETYNRLYVEDVDRGYFVFDQILPLNIEVCDILKYTDKTVYLYHVKAKFGQETREVCSQILNSATLIRNALSLQQSENILETLYNVCVNRSTSGNSWFDPVQDKLRSLGKDGFMEIFQSNRNIVFVYAYVPEEPNKSFYYEAKKPSHITRKMLGQGNESLGKVRRELLQELGCLDPTGAGRLTNYFLSLTKDKFIEIAKAKFTQKDSEDIYNLLMRAKPFSQSVLARMEVVRLAQNLASLGFDFKICEISKE